MDTIVRFAQPWIDRAARIGADPSDDWRFEVAPGEIGTHPSIMLRPAAAMPGRMRSVA